MTKATFKNVNAAIADKGIELVKGTGYFYFAILDGFPDDTYIPDSVYVCRLSDLPKETWIRWAQ